MNEETKDGVYTILISEDETEIRELLVLLFEAEGFNVLSASDGQSALELVQRHGTEIALLITDLGLPNIGGVELISKARRIVPTLKVIAASGFGHSNVRAELMAVGVTDFFPKPFSPADLLATARKLIGKTTHGAGGHE